MFTSFQPNGNGGLVRELKANPTFIRDRKTVERDVMDSLDESADFVTFSPSPFPISPGLSYPATPNMFDTTTQHPTMHDIMMKHAQPPPTSSIYPTVYPTHSTPYVNELQATSIMGDDVMARRKNAMQGNVGMNVVMVVDNNDMSSVPTTNTTSSIPQHMSLEQFQSYIDAQPTTTSLPSLATLLTSTTTSAVKTSTSPKTKSRSSSKESEEESLIAARKARHCGSERARREKLKSATNQLKAITKCKRHDQLSIINAAITLITKLTSELELVKDGKQNDKMDDVKPSPSISTCAPPPSTSTALVPSTRTDSCFHYRSAFLSPGFARLLLHLDLRVADFNQDFTALTGWTRSDLPTLTGWSISPQCEVAAIYRFTSLLLSGVAKQFRVAKVCCNRNGSLSFAEAVVAVVEQDSRPSHIMLTLLPLQPDAFITRAQQLRREFQATLPAPLKEVWEQECGADQASLFYNPDDAATLAVPCGSESINVSKATLSPISPSSSEQSSPITSSSSSGSNSRVSSPSSSHCGFCRGPCTPHHSLFASRSMEPGKPPTEPPASRIPQVLGNVGITPITPHTNVTETIRVPSTSTNSHTTSQPSHPSTAPHITSDSFISFLENPTSPVPPNDFLQTLNALPVPPTPHELVECAQPKVYPF